MDNNKKRGVVENLKKWCEDKRTSYFAILTVCILLIVIAFMTCSKTNNNDTGRPLPISDAIDSIASVLPKGSEIIARFPDEERHGLYYLNSGVFYFFDGKQRILEEVAVSGIASGNIISALLTPDEEYITLTVQDGDIRRLYRLNTHNRNVADLNQVVATPDSIKPKANNIEKKVVEDAGKEQNNEVQQPKDLPKEPKREGVLTDVMEEQ